MQKEVEESLNLDHYFASRRITLGSYEENDEEFEDEDYDILTTREIENQVNCLCLSCALQPTNQNGV